MAQACPLHFRHSRMNRSPPSSPPQVVDALLAAQGASLSAAKRNRLRCLKAAVLAMARPDGPRAAAEAGASREEATKQVGCAGGWAGEGPLSPGAASNWDHRGQGCIGQRDAWTARHAPRGARRPITPRPWPGTLSPPCHVQLVAGMVSEIILAVKERNKQTRATAFELLVQVRPWGPACCSRCCCWAGSWPCFPWQGSKAGGGGRLTFAALHPPSTPAQIAHAMHEAEPPPPGLGLGGAMDMGDDGELPLSFGGARACLSGWAALHFPATHHQPAPPATRSRVPRPSPRPRLAL